jgi:hypothetical protein
MRLTLPLRNMDLMAKNWLFFSSVGMFIQKKIKVTAGVDSGYI